MALVVLDALTRRGWVKEDDLAQDLKIGSKYLRRVLRYLEQVREQQLTQNSSFSANQVRMSISAFPPAAWAQSACLIIPFPWSSSI